MSKNLFLAVMAFFLISFATANMNNGVQNAKTDLQIPDADKPDGGTDPKSDFAGHITQNTVWTEDMLITGDVWIDAGITLTIFPGVKVKFAYIDANANGIGDLNFYINGQLFAQGTPENKVYFMAQRTTPTTKDWVGITYGTPESGQLSTLSNVVI